MSSMNKNGTSADTQPHKETGPAAMNAVELLETDHRKVRALFKQLEQTEEDDRKVALAQQICRELSLHAECEEAIFYPAARKALGAESDDMLDEAAVEHRTLKTLMAEIDGTSPADPFFDANLTVLKEYVEHHVKEEEREMFPLVAGGKLDLDALGVRLAEKKAQLQARAGEPRAPRAGTKARVHLPAIGKSVARSKTAASTAKENANGRGARPASGSHSAH